MIIFRNILVACAFAGGSLSAQQLPAGTHLPDDATAVVDPVVQQRTQAEDALNKQDLPTAEKLLQAVLEKNPKDARALYDLGFLKEQANDDAAAEKNYRSSLEIDPKQFDSHLPLGLLLARKGDVNGAHEQLLAATQSTASGIDPLLKAHAYRALARLDVTENPEEARTRLIEALKLSPETTEDTLLTAELAEKSGDVEATRTAYRRLLERSPDNPEAVGAYAHLLVRTGNASEAEALLKSATEKHPDNLALAAQLASLYGSTDRGGEAIPLLERLHASNPANAEVSRMLARLYIQQSQPEKANPLYTALVSSSPQDASLLDDWGDALIRQKRFSEAEAVLQKAFAGRTSLPTKDDQANIASHLAFAASENHDPQTVLQALAVRDTVVPASASSLFLAATAHDTLHHTKQAADLYRQFLALANGKFPDQEWEARHRIIALDHAK